MTFRTKRDAEDWVRRTEDEMIRSVYVRRSSSEKTLVQDALKRYLKEITPTKRPSTQRAEKMRAKPLTAQLGK
jgi:predicted transcriptional regulator